MSIFPEKILLATDGSEDSILASRVATELSSTTESELHVVHVRSTLGQAPGYYTGPHVEGVDLQRLDTEAQRLLNAQVERIESAGGLVRQAHLKVGRPDAEIVTLAEELGTDLLVVGSRGEGGMRRALMGSVSDSVVRHAHCPVLVVRREEKVEEVGALFPTK
ncbi:MAG: universal stress protein, partial [Rubrobacter sp.]|nr:universal stress protein [Rubrobacter sp.]